MSKEEDSERKGPFRRAVVEAGPYLTFGLELCLTMIVWVILGYFLDRWLDTAPWFAAAGALVGMISVFVRIARIGRLPPRETRGKE
jgi:F0F1-type ATP synthase assembly protein I